MPFSAFVAASLAPESVARSRYDLRRRARSRRAGDPGSSRRSAFPSAVCSTSRPRRPGSPCCPRGAARHTAVRVIGAGYLVYLGVAMLRQASRHEMAVSIAPASDWAVFCQGGDQRPNPKVALFFLAFLPQVRRRGARACRRPDARARLVLQRSGTLVNVVVACLAGSAHGVSRLECPAVAAAGERRRASSAWARVSRCPGRTRARSRRTLRCRRRPRAGRPRDFAPVLEDSHGRNRPMRNRSPRSLKASVLTFTIRNRPCARAATLTSSGATMRQGPHHGAQ